MMIQSISINEKTLTIHWQSGSDSTFHYIWLRDNCQSPKSLHPNGQRLLQTVDIPADIHPSSVQVIKEQSLEIVWVDGHQSSYSADWLYNHVYDMPLSGSNNEMQIQRWNCSVDINSLTFDYPEIISKERTLYDWLVAFCEYGVAFLKNVPTQLGAVENIVDQFGYIHETNFGRISDVKIVTNATNLTYTNDYLSPHTDNPYRDPAPTLMLLHCLSSDVEGGDSIIVDGFQVAEKLRQKNPKYFKLLASIPVNFCFSDPNVEISAEKTIIQVNWRDELTAVCFHNESLQPFRMDAELIGSFYDAYRTFFEMIMDVKNQVQFKLQPGQVYMVDNRRVLHGRTAFFNTDKRHLQGCYAGIDGLYSKLAVLKRHIIGT
ncbi:MAG: DUF971 domain-containing protein [Moorea sp. SIOASIH]|uniref:TauD/TfdA family dioxygenase n=1 Tax=Moorena sp. SIOASIH TaxID=2607817 RepID=UPI0013BB43D0|nr:TauD/TfdA family dioxygenase [Moorena sp. SIOASIH]NEO40963.1 DUF971 domain-containing protein [Moorena sp. SIOASIH]